MKSKSTTSWWGTLPKISQLTFAHKAYFRCLNHLKPHQLNIRKGMQRATHLIRQQLTSCSTIMKLFYIRLENELRYQLSFFFPAIIWNSDISYLFFYHNLRLYLRFFSKEQGSQSHRCISLQWRQAQTSQAQNDLSSLSFVWN